jgi:uncharacterized delta-60 repeat protein
MKRQLFHPISLLSVFLCLYTAVSAQPELDITFNGTGRVTTQLSAGGSDSVSSVLVQADNKIIAVGTYAASGSPRFFALTRYNTNGALDSLFGAGGKVITDFDANAVNEGALAAAIQPDGKIIAAGYVSLTSPGPGFFALARYNTNGSLDTTFGNGGKVLTAIVQHINTARGVAVGQDGKIVAAGEYFGSLQNFQTLIARYGTTGALEGTTTDQRGVDLGDSNTPMAVTVQQDGKILTAGYFRSNFSGPSGADITMLRFTADGVPDASFAGSGRLLIPSPTVNEFLMSVAVQADGRIVAGGSSASDFLVMRFNADGSPDLTFGGGTGRVTTPMGGFSQANSVIVKPNGKILASGTVEFSGWQNFAIACYNAHGSLDTSFSGDGKLAFNFGGMPSLARGMALDGLGRIVLGGYASIMFGVARLYTADPVPVTVTGRTLLQNGQPIKGVNMALTNQAGETLYAFTSPFGYFQFQVPTGQTYTLSVSSKRYTFETRVFGVNEAIDNLSLIGTPITPRPGGDNLNERKNMPGDSVPAPGSMRRRTGVSKSIY